MSSSFRLAANKYRGWLAVRVFIIYKGEGKMRWAGATTKEGTDE